MYILILLCMDLLIIIVIIIYINVRFKTLIFIIFIGYNDGENHMKFRLPWKKTETIFEIAKSI